VKKRTFLKLSSSLVTGVILSPMMSCKKSERPHNWAGNFTYSTDRVFDPKTEKEAKDLIKEYAKVKIQGTRHSFNNIADSDENLIQLKHLDEISLDRERKKVTVGAAITYGKLSPYLHSNGFALHNLASLPHISVAGACATGTHGSGVGNGNLSTAVSAFELITASGDTIALSREKDGERFLATVVNLGAIGAITKMTLDIQPTFNVRQDLFENLPLAELKTHLDEILSSGYSTSLFTDWKTDFINQVWVKSRVEEGTPFESKTDLFGAKPATRNLHPIVELSAENCTEQMGVPGPWHERLPHFKMNFTPSSGAELQSEYFVSRKDGYEALMAINRMRNEIFPLLMISEIRTIAADDFWMSPCYKRDSMAIHFTWHQDWTSVSKVLPIIEEQLAPFKARPHWAKLFTMAPDYLNSLYPKRADFKKLCIELDPNGKFRNEYLSRNVY
jgi:alditol oxidase